MVASDRQLLLACLAMALLLRLPVFAWPLGIDEGGYAYVAANWSNGEGGIYGAQWIDRPPLLIALYAVAVAAAGDIGVRLLGVVAALVVVVTCADVARRAGGRRAFRWTAAIGTLLVSSSAIQSTTVNAEVPAIAFTSLAAWLLVRAYAAQVGAGWWAAGAGMSAMCALLVKQSFADGYAFALGLLVTVAVLERHRVVRALGLAAAGFCGALFVAGLAGAWAATRGPGVRVLLEALYGFRVQALEAMSSTSGAPQERAWLLLALAVVTGLLALFAFSMVGAIRMAAGRLLLRDAPDATLMRGVAGGLVLMGAFGMLAVLLGGNWWRHYLIQLVPTVAIGAGLAAAAAPGGARSRVARHSRRWGRVVAATTVLTWIVVLAWTTTSSVGRSRDEVVVADWLRAAARSDDTALVTWGHANLLARSGLQTPYGMAWSLPVRVRDPQLEQLESLLDGDRAPTWIVQWLPINSWQLDTRGDVRRLVRARYERVTSICGRDVLRLREAASGSVPKSPPSSKCGTDAVPYSLGLPRW